MLNALVPVALYYGLRAVGASVYLALLAGAVVPALTTLGGVIRSRTIDRLGAFMLTIMLFGVAVALIAGGPRFLLAKEAWVTAAVGVWFLLSARGPRPLSFVFARAMLEGRPPFTDEPWDELLASGRRRPGADPGAVRGVIRGPGADRPDQLSADGAAAAAAGRRARLDGGCPDLV